MAWLTILVIICLVQVARQQWIDALIFAVAAALLGVEALGLLRRLDAIPRPALSITIAVGAASAVGLLLAPRHSTAAGLVMVVIAAAALLSTWRSTARESAPWPRALRMLGWWWATVGIVACIWEVLQVALGGLVVNGRVEHPALSDLVNPLLDVQLGKIVFVLLWMTLGVYLVRRGVRR